MICMCFPNNLLIGLLFHFIIFAAYEDHYCDYINKYSDKIPKHVRKKNHIVTQSLGCRENKTKSLQTNIILHLHNEIKKGQTLLCVIFVICFAHRIFVKHIES